MQLNSTCMLAALLLVTLGSTVLGQQARINPARHVDVAQVRQVHRLSDIAGYREYTGRLIVRPKAGVLERVASDLVESQTIDYKGQMDCYILEVPAESTDRAYAAALEATGLYDLVEPDWEVYATATTPNDPRIGNQWHHSVMQSRLAWDITIGDPNIVIAIVDTGIDVDHPDLAGQLVPGRLQSLDLGNAIESFPGEFTNDTHGHGTGVAGTAAAVGNNGIGGAGMGWNFSIMPIKVTDGITAYTSDIVDGCIWAARNGADIVNASFSGGDSFSASLAGTGVWDAGGLLFWAAGNENNELFGFDSSAYVIVAATTSTDSRWSSSNFGNPVDIAAPGASIYMPWVGGGYSIFSGTSFASPIAAGSAAMIWSVNPDLTSEEVQDVLFSTADDIGESQFNVGHGRINLFNAVTAALNYNLDQLLSVQSSHPLDQPIFVTPTDVNGEGDGVPPFERLFERNASITLSAPIDNNERQFDRWDVNGREVSRDPNYSFAMASPQTITAVYSNKIMIRSTPTGANMLLSPADLGANSVIQAPLETDYFGGTDNLELTVLPIHEGRDFVEWRIDEQFVSSSTRIVVSTDHDFTIKAVYEGILGDLNCSGTTDSFDIEAFIDALLNPSIYHTNYPDCDRMLADLNQDGTVTSFDIEFFIDLLMNS